MSWYDDRQRTLTTRMEQLRGQPITYYNGLTTVSIPSAVVNEYKPQDLIAMGIATDARHRDYIIRCDLLSTSPKQGDRITDGNLLCLVAPMGDEPCFRYTNHQRTHYRIHTSVAGNTTTQPPAIP